MSLLRYHFHHSAAAPALAAEAAAAATGAAAEDNEEDGSGLSSAVAITEIWTISLPGTMMVPKCLQLLVCGANSSLLVKIRLQSLSVQARRPTTTLLSLSKIRSSLRSSEVISRRPAVCCFAGAAAASLLVLFAGAAGAAGAADAADADTDADAAGDDMPRPAASSVKAIAAAVVSSVVDMDKTCA